MKIKYRPHKGSLDKSMSYMKEFNSIHAMKNHIVDIWNGYIAYDDIIIDENIVYDKRIEWNTQDILVKGTKDTIYTVPQCIAMCHIEKEVKENG